MNFFAAQDRARKNTGWLILLFTLAVVGLILLTNLLLLGVLSYSQTGQLSFSPQTLQYSYSWHEFAAVSIGVCLLIFCGSLYKSMALSGGGSTVAEMLGGHLISTSTTDLQQRQLLNVVEEMAIAAGMPVPRVYLLDETAINAFAAGWSQGDAVIGVTRGTLQRLNRDELQGVIGHEFGHILNGDMRLNIRLIGVLHGILLIGMIGYYILRSLRFSGRSRNSKSSGGIAAIAVLGIGLMVIGYAGSFFGQWIKASVSRQREYLADSSAVQFTRNREGISGALKKIGGASGSVGSYINAPAAAEYSHAYFANGIGSFWQSLFSTHPPLEKRIKQLDPTWDGQFLSSRVNTTPPVEPVKGDNATIIEKLVTATILSSAEQAISRTGTLNEENILYVQQLIAAMPPTLRTNVQEAYGARATMYALLVSLQKDRIHALKALEAITDSETHKLLDQLLPQFETLDERFILPLLELATNALRDMSSNQFIQFKTGIEKVMSSDQSINLREWIIQRTLVQQLELHFGFRKPARSRYKNLAVVQQPLTIVLSLIAYVENKDDSNARQAFNIGVKQSGCTNLEILPRLDFKLVMLDTALDQLTRLMPLVKPALLKACMATILADGKTTTRGIELVRTISICLDCPMPPIAQAPPEL